MNSSKGITVMLAALLVVSATAGAYFYTEYQQASQSNRSYTNELTTATVEYASVASNYNSSLSLDNQTLSLLAGTIGIVNTSLPAYQQASAALSQLWSRYLALKPPSSSLFAADILIDFGNGTKDWYNHTQVQPGWNMYTETVVLTNGNLQAQWYPEYQEHLVSGIDGVSGTQTQSWFLWEYNATSWQLAPVGVDDLPVYNGSVIAWTFCAVSATDNPECSP